MKCEKCGKEATFHYQSIVNNVKTECHLCEDCSREEGYGDFFKQAVSPMFGGAFGEMRPFMSPFAAFSPFTSGMLPQMMAIPVLNFLPATNGVSTTPEEKSADNIPEDAGESFRRRREINALKHQMHHAARTEDFEKAAELRDKIREMEK